MSEDRPHDLSIVRPWRYQLRCRRQGVNEKTAPGSHAREAACETERIKSDRNPRNDRACALTGACVLMAATSAQHAEGRQLMARRVYHPRRRVCTRCVKPCVPKRRKGSRLLRLAARFSLSVRAVPGEFPEHPHDNESSRVALKVEARGGPLIAQDDLCNAVI